MSTSNTTFPDEYLPLLGVGQVITVPIVTVMVMYIVYGFYVLLFGLCMYVLRRGRLRHRNLYMSWTSMLFLLSTLSVIVETIYVLHRSSVRYLFVKNHHTQLDLDHDMMGAALYISGIVLLILSNVVAESVLIHRCYVIWGFKKRVAFSLALTSCATNVVSATSLILFFVGYKHSNGKTENLSNTILGSALIASAAFNLGLTLLAAGRIWWIMRNISQSKTKALRTINKIMLNVHSFYSTRANTLPLSLLP
ncbi:hypothetical protein PM082_013698 [Marasmius tenuissimus]|nr:hypothetical protein PM082_013698 [Marasmius tenuissimus]